MGQFPIEEKLLTTRVERVGNRLLTISIAPTIFGPYADFNKPRYDSKLRFNYHDNGIAFTL